MMLKTLKEQDIKTIIEKDRWMMEILKSAQSLRLPDWWICAGFVRSKVWDTLHGYSKRTPLPDVDVIYFDAKNTEERTEKEFEIMLTNIMPGVPWSVKNQARMHVINGVDPYHSAVDGIAHFPETVTALGVKLDETNNLFLAAPYGITDLIHLMVWPTPTFITSKRMIRIYQERMRKKNWQSLWPEITIKYLDKI